MVVERLDKVMITLADRCLLFVKLLEMFMLVMKDWKALGRVVKLLRIVETSVLRIVK